MIIDNPTDQQPLRRLWKQAFGDSDSFLDSFFSVAYSPERCRQLTLNGNVCAALYWFDCSFQDQPLAYLYAVATDEACRGQGLCRALMEDTHRHLKELGYSSSIVVPESEELFSLYEKLGYHTCSCLNSFTCQPGAPVDLQQIDAAEYAQLRRRFLPENGVVQEGPLLSFLQTQTSFYAGTDFVLCASLNGSSLTVPELLGNASAAPGITAALKARQGHFRTPGSQHPFAMYHPLSDPAKAPGYFALALD